MKKIFIKINTMIFGIASTISDVYAVLDGKKQEYEEVSVLGGLS
jgi:hypothetical protein